MDKIENISQELKNFITTELLELMELGDLPYSDKQGVASATMAKILIKIQDNLTLDVTLTDDDWLNLSHMLVTKTGLLSPDGFDTKLNIVVIGGKQ